MISAVAIPFATVCAAVSSPTMNMADEEQPAEVLNVREKTKSGTGGTFLQSEKSLTADGRRNSMSNYFATGGCTDLEEPITNSEANNLIRDALEDSDSSDVTSMLGTDVVAI